MSYTLRQADESDFEFVKKLHHETLREYVEPIWGWDEDRQDQFVKNWFKPERIKIVQVKTINAGLILVAERKEDIFLESISITPKLQGKGIGSAVIRDVMLQAKQKNRPLRLQVLKTNPNARRLYERLGFVLEDTTDTHFELVAY